MLSGYSFTAITNIFTLRLTVCGSPLGFTYSLFHQILGVAFFQFARSLFKKKYSRISFLSSPNIPETLVDFFCVLAKLDHLTCNTFSKYSSL